MGDGMSQRIVRARDAGSLADISAGFFADMARSSIAARDSFRVALSGGSTPKAMFGALSGETYRDAVDWSRVQVFFSDERFVPPDSAESNFRMANEALLSKVPIPERQVHRVATVDITPQQSASNYEEGIRRVFHAGLDDTPRFDLILLGLGPDGHTASLFPGTEALGEEESLVVPNFVPKFDSWRITFTYRLINAAAVVAFLAQGEEKAERVAQVMSGDRSLPAAGVNPSGGELVWLLDDAAAAQAPAGTPGA